ncbi:ankyrin repeat domain-containing protein [Terriglobus roseus]|nr:ankyrin repeat domain-containing protein [Terriglobus roseus]
MQAWPAAQAVVYGWTYRPFLRSGEPVIALIQSSISIVPPEVPPSAVPEPGLKPDSQIILSLQRTVCYGSCPEYTVILSNTGVTFEGGRWSAEDGTHHAPLEQDALRAVAKHMLDAGWFGLKDSYHGNWTDNPAQTITLSIDGKTKKVVDYVGTDAGMPDFVRDAEFEVDHLAGSDRWVKAASGLAMLLQAEGYDFKTYAAQSLLRSAASNGDASSVRELLAAGVARDTLAKPLQQIQTWGESWSGYDGLLTTAVRHPDVLKVMIASRVSSQNELEKNLAFVASVRAGQAESARLLLAYGADPTVSFGELKRHTDASAYWINDSTDLLTSAVKSANPEVVQLVLVTKEWKDPLRVRRGKFLVDLAYSANPENLNNLAECAHLLLQAGADVGATDDRGRTALHFARGASFAKELVEAGANVDAQDVDGNTPTFSTYDPDIFRILVRHGANLQIRNRAGQNAMQNPHRSAQEWAPIYAEFQAKPS